MDINSFRISFSHKVNKVKRPILRGIKRSNEFYTLMKAVNYIISILIIKDMYYSKSKLHAKKIIVNVYMPIFFGNDVDNASLIISYLSKIWFPEVGPFH